MIPSSLYPLRAKVYRLKGLWGDLFWVILGVFAPLQSLSAIIGKPLTPVSLHEMMKLDSSRTHTPFGSSLHSIDCEAQQAATEDGREWKGERQKETDKGTETGKKMEGE